MRYIDKSIVKAHVYKKWEEELNSAGKAHPPYNSSNFKYYYDIVFELLKCQKGLCAYSEKFLCSVDERENDVWIEDRCDKFSFAGQLDHYDPQLKKSKGWLWDNFFMVDTDLNMKDKRTDVPSGTLKPDKPGFDANDYLDYDLKKHIFFPRFDLHADIKDKVRNDLFVLGVNFEPIVQARKEYLSPYISRLKYEQQDKVSIQSELYQFHTAFLMLSAKLR